jgi:hypothetical protein
VTEAGWLHEHDPIQSQDGERIWGGEKSITVEVYRTYLAETDRCPPPVHYSIAELLDRAYLACSTARQEVTRFTVRMEPHVYGTPGEMPVLRIRLDVTTRPKPRPAMGLVEMFTMVAEALHEHRKRARREAARRDESGERSAGEDQD